MAKHVDRYLVRIFVASGWLMLIAGCDTVTHRGLPIDLSTPSTDLAMFIQQFAREALAAFVL